MLTKILLTALVIVVAMYVLRNRAAPVRAKAQRQPVADDTISPRVIAYTIVGILATVSAVVFTWNWVESHRVVQIRVTDGASGQSVEYQAYQSAIDGRSFTTVDGLRVTLGSADRVEMTEPH